MNSPLGNGRTSTGGPMKLPPMLLLAAFFLSGLGLSGQTQAQLSLVCPCSVVKDGDTHVTIMAGIENSRTAATNKLRVVLGAAASPKGSFSLSQLATVPHASIAGSMASSSREFTVGYRFPGVKALSSAFDAEGNTHLILALEEYDATAGVDGMRRWLTSDIVRLAPAGETAMALTQSRMALTRARMFPASGGETGNGSIYIEGAPTIDTMTTAGMVAVTIPKVVNSGDERITLTSANLVHTHARQFFGVTFVSATRGVVTFNPAVTIAPGGIATNVSFTSTYVNPVNARVNNGGSTTTETFGYTHLSFCSAPLPKSMNRHL